MADIEIRQAPPTAFYIKVHDADNVAIIVNDNGLKAGTRFPDGLELTEHVPQGHKVALVDIPAESEIVRYGEVIGYAVRSIPQGSWVEESLVALPEAPPLNTLPLATRVPEPLPPLEGYTFEGYRNADGSVGTKNLLGITTSVHCVAGVVDYVVQIIERDLLPKYPNVDGVVGLNHLYGCGVAINAPAAVVPIRTIHNIALNPNFGGEVMVIGLGCEKLQPERLLQGTEDVKAIPADEVSIVRLQDERRFPLNGRRYFAGSRTPSGQAQPPPARNVPGVGAGGRNPVRRQRCLLRRDGQSGGGLCIRSACTLRRHGDVLRGD